MAWVDPLVSGWSSPGTTVTVTSGSITLTLPPGFPTVGHQANDLYVAVIAYRGNAAFSAPAGWTIREQISTGNTFVNSSGGTSASGIVIAECIRGGSTPNLTFTRTGGDVAIGAITQLRSNAGGAPIFIASDSTQQASSTTTPSTPGGSAIVADQMIVGCFAGARASPTSSWTANGWGDTKVLDVTTTSGADASISIADGTIPTSGTVFSTVGCSASPGAMHCIGWVSYRESAGAISLTPSSISTSSPSIGTPALVSGAPPVVTSAPSIGTPAIGQKHFLTATAISTGTVAISTPALGAPNAIYVATTGNNSNPGTFGSPKATLQGAHDIAVAGDTIYMRGGTYNMSACCQITRDGTSGNPIKVFPYATETVILDGTNIPGGNYSASCAIRLNGANWWHFFGLEIRYCPDWGMRIEGSSSNNIFELLDVHHTGLDASGNDNSGLPFASGEGKGIFFVGSGTNNLFKNVDSHHNTCPNKDGADGFQIAPTGTGNVMDGCRAWLNVDDGIDLYQVVDGVTSAPVIMRRCWAWGNGYEDDWVTQAGNGTGFKLGGQRATSGNADHILENCVSWGNRVYGFYENGSDSNLTLRNCSAYDNWDTSISGNEYNYIVQTGHTLVNCLDLSPGNRAVTGATVTTCSWTIGGTIDSADFVSLVDTGARGARQSDGSLPNTTFLKLVSGSNLRNAGTNVGIPFEGAAPDIGAFEYASTTVHSLTASNLATTGPAIGTPALTVIKVLTANSIATSAPSIGSPAIGQKHNIAASFVTTAAPAIASPTLAQVHALIANAMTLSAPSIGSPAIGQKHVISAAALATSAPSIGSPALGQFHVLTASAIATTGPAITTPALVFRALLTPTSISTAAPATGLGALTQNHALLASAIETHPPTMSQPGVALASTLLPNALTSGPPSLGTPTLAQYQFLVGNSYAAGPPSLATPLLGQNHALTPLGLSTSAAALATPLAGSVIVVVPLNPVSIGIGTPSIAVTSFSQNHVMGSLGGEIKTNEPVIAAVSINQKHNIFPYDFSTSLPEIDLNYLAQNHAFGALDLVSAPPEIHSPSIFIPGKAFPVAAMLAI